MLEDDIPFQFLFLLALLYYNYYYNFTENLSCLKYHPDVFTSRYWHACDVGVEDGCDEESSKVEAKEVGERQHGGNSCSDDHHEAK